MGDHAEMSAAQGNDAELFAQLLDERLPLGRRERQRHEQQRLTAALAGIGNAGAFAGL